MSKTPDVQCAADATPAGAVGKLRRSQVTRKPMKRNTTKKRTVGYIVLDADMQAMWLETRASARKDARGVLWIAGQDITLFSTREAAKGAIQRTNDYAYAHGLTGIWKTDYRIKRVAEE